MSNANVDLRVEPCPKYVFTGMLDGSWTNSDVYEEMLGDESEDKDQFMSMLCSVNTNFDEMDA